MARKISNTIEFFQHFANKQSRTVAKLESKYGNDGYSFLFRLLEILAATENHFLDLSEPADMDYFATRQRLPPETCENIIADLVNWKKIDRHLWESKRGVWYEKFVSNHSHVYEKRRRALPEKPAIPAPEIPAKPDSCSENASTPRIPVTESTHSIVEYSIAQNSIVEDSINASLTPPLFESGNSEGVEEKKEKPKEKSSAKKEKVQEHYFDQSPYYDRVKFLEAFTRDKYPINDFPDTDTSHYYNQIKHWAEYGSGNNPGKQKKKDWLATARTFMKGDIDKGKLKTKPAHLKVLKNEPDKDSPEYYEQLKKQYDFSQTA